MKFTKLATASALTLALAGTSVFPAMAEEKEPLHQEPVNLNSDSVNPDEDHNGSDGSIILFSTPVANYTNVGLVQGSFTLNFHIGVSNKDVRYYVKNSGNNSFAWKILDPKGKTWSSGSLKPGEAANKTAFWDLDYIPVGEYTLSVTSHNGGSGTFDFSARVLD